MGKWYNNYEAKFQWQRINKSGSLAKRATMLVVMKHVNPNEYWRNMRVCSLALHQGTERLGYKKFLQSVILFQDGEWLILFWKPNLRNKRYLKGSRLSYIVLKCDIVQDHRYEKFYVETIIQ